MTECKEGLNWSEGSLERWWDGWEDVVEVLHTGAWLWPEGKEQEVYSEEEDEEDGGPGLSHRHLRPVVGVAGHGRVPVTVSPVYRAQSQFTSFNIWHF